MITKTDLETIFHDPAIMKQFKAVNRAYNNRHKGAVQARHYKQKANALVKAIKNGPSMSLNCGPNFNLQILGGKNHEALQH